MTNLNRTATQFLRCGLLLAWLPVSALGDQPEPGSRPACVIRLSNQFVQHLFANDFTHEQPVQECVLGTRVQGLANTTGILTVELDSQADMAAFWLHIRGVARSTTTGRSGPVVVTSTYRTVYTARTRFVFAADRGLYYREPQVSVQTKREQTDVQSTLPGVRGRIAQRIARRRLSRDASLLQQIATRNARQRILRNVEELLAERTERANTRLWVLEPAFKEMRRVSQSRWHFSSSDEWLNLSLLPLSAKTDPTAVPGFIKKPYSFQPGERLWAEMWLDSEQSKTEPRTIEALLKILAIALDDNQPDSDESDKQDLRNLAVVSEEDGSLAHFILMQRKHPPRLGRH